jgi:hypothetical protein
MADNLVKALRIKGISKNSQAAQVGERFEL